jgi:peptidase C25-like protein/flagellar hook capping protein FlgD
MVKRIIFAATILILSITTFSQSTTELKFTGLKVSSFNQNEIIIKWNVTQIQINPVVIDNKEYSSISFEGCDFTDEIGLPEIPFKDITLGIPNNATLQYSLSNIKYETIENITPLPVGQPFRDKSGITSLIRRENKENYNFNPKEIIVFSQQEYFKDMPVVQVKYYPVSYDHTTNTIKYIKSADIRVTIRDGKRSNSKSTSNKYLQDLYNEYIINYSQAQNWLIPKSKTFAKTAFVPQGPWYKIEVTEDGLYKIATTTLTAAGIDISTIDPRTFQLFNNGGKPLNINALSTENNPTEPVENSIYVSGETDGSFDAGDYILFYGTELGGWNFSSSNNDFIFIQHPYDTKNYYWLTFGNATGRRIQQATQTTATATTNDTYFWRRVHFEEELSNLMSSGADWYGYRFFGSSGQNSFNYQISNLSGTSNPAKLVVRLKGGSAVLYSDNSSYSYYFTTYLNPVNQPNAIVPQRFFRSSRSIAQNDADYLRIEQSFNSTDYLLNGSNTLKLDYIGSTESCNAYLDYVEFYYPGDFTATNDYLSFYTNTIGQVVSYNINNFNTSDVKLFDISNPTNVTEISTGGIQNNNLSFKLDLTSNTNKRLIASSLTSSEINNISSISLFTPSKNLFDQSIQGELIIITPPNYMSYGDEIVNLRNSGEIPISGTVVNTEDIYFYFGSGVKDPTAIRNFIRHAYNYWTVSPNYVLLFGDGHYDYRNISISDTNFIPPFEISHSWEIDSRESDNYYVDINNTSYTLDSIRPDLAIGRLPVESHLDSRRIVDKLIAYEESKSHDGWQTVFTFVADDTDPDGITFQSNTDNMANLGPLKKFLKRKIYLTAYNSVPGGFGRVKPEANNAIIDQINEGSLFINFVGHGSSQVWAHENVFEMNRDLNRLQNEGKLSIFIAATCTFGKYDNPLDPSFTEALIWRENSGAIGVIAASRAVYNSSNVNFNTKYYESLFPNGAASRRLGDALVLATSTSSNYQKFHLFADPSMFPADPRNIIEISSVRPDTLKALSKVSVDGIVNKDSSIWQNFTGGATVIVNDAKFENVNTGGGHAYTVDGPRIFKGEISINNGAFSNEFIVPKSIRYQDRKTGRVTIYAWNEQGNGDALGYIDTLLFYGTTNLVDEDGPEIDLYFDGQEHFNEGDLVSDNPSLVAEISDENGINLTQEVGHIIEIQIDDESTKDITTFFSYDRDSYSDGKLKYHLENLKDGPHQLSVKAWDNLNNPTTKLINFQVVQNDGIVLQNVVNFPNPFASDTYFTFQTLGSTGSEVIIKIYTIGGRLIKTIEGNLVNSDGFNKIHWDGRDEDGDKIANGVYPYKLILKNGNESKEKIEKLVVLK